jgi:TetR/AcrR family transcriptional regulator, repressor for uid operon
MRVSGEAKQTTQARLLGAAAAEFSRVGFERASIDAISTAAGYGKGTVYNYFDSKEELFVAVVDAATTQAAGTASGADGATARERLRLVLEAFCGWACEHDALARVLVRECLMGTPGLYPQVIAAEQPLIGELEAILREGARAGELRDDLPSDLLAAGLAGLVDLALVRSWASDGADLTIGQIPELVLQALLGPESNGKS